MNSGNDDKAMQAYAAANTPLALLKLSLLLVDKQRFDEAEKVYSIYYKFLSTRDFTISWR